MRKETTEGEKCEIVFLKKIKKNVKMIGNLLPGKPKQS